MRPMPASIRSRSPERPVELAPDVIAAQPDIAQQMVVQSLQMSPAACPRLPVQCQGPGRLQGPCRPGGQIVKAMRPALFCGELLHLHILVIRPEPGRCRVGFIFKGYGPAVSGQCREENSRVSIVATGVPECRKTDALPMDGEGAMSLAGLGHRSPAESERIAAARTDR